MIINFKNLKNWIQLWGVHTENQLSKSSGNCWSDRHEPDFSCLFFFLTSAGRQHLLKGRNSVCCSRALQQNRTHYSSWLMRVKVLQMRQKYMYLTTWCILKMLMAQSASSCLWPQVKMSSFTELSVVYCTELRTSTVPVFLWALFEVNTFSKRGVGEVVGWVCNVTQKMLFGKHAAVILQTQTESSGKISSEAL